LKSFTPTVLRHALPDLDHSGLLELASRNGADLRSITMYATR
jgi:DNA-binding GntR family transcriptional regulator